MNTPRPLSTLRRRLRAALMLTLLATLPWSASAAESARQNYQLPAGDAASTLRAFSKQSGEQIVYPVDAVRGVRTQAVSGELGAREALERMLEGTNLVVVQDSATGALAVQTREAAERNAQTMPATDLRPAVKLAEYRVLGTRIRQTDTAGPSPVSVYDADYIRATGALTLADFFNYLPQNYAGISAGRNSAPNELNPEFGQRTENFFPATNLITGAASAPPGQTGVSGVSLRGLGSGSTLVLVDGRRAAQSGAGNRGSDSRQGFVDLNTIPFGMVERIEISTDGASAIYGADAVAGVINIVLKKNWVGNEIVASFKGAFHGGGREREITALTGFSRGKLRGTASVSYYDRADLKASQRNFSKNQDHRGIVAGYDASGNPVMGRDLRLNWGYPSVVQARTGMLTGFFRPDGVTPTNVALTPEGYATTPPLSAFTGVGPVPPNTNVFATQQRRGNTSEFLDLIPSSERYSFAGNFDYTFHENLDAYAKYSYTDTRGLFNTQPAVSSAATSSGFGNVATIVPAAYNPFGQDVAVGMIHYEFGSIWQKTKTQAHSAVFGLRGRIGQTWEWDSGIGYQHQSIHQLRRDFNPAGITAALNTADDAVRINPFIDARVAGYTQVDRYERLAVYPTVDAESSLFDWDFDANGDLFDVPGGTVRAAFGGAYSHAENENVAVNYSNAATPVASTSAVVGKRNSYAFFSEVSVPVFGKANSLPLLKRFDIQLAGRYEDYDRAGNTFVPKYGISWAPVQSLLFRASYSEGFRAPGLTEYQVATAISTGSVLDPKRTPTNTTGVSLTRGSNGNVQPETSKNEFYGLVFEPEFLKGFNFQVNYYRTTQENVIQLLGAQAIVNNEALFADRITRAAPDANDVTLNQPGRITAIDQTFVNFGEVVNHSLDFVVDYRIPQNSTGRWILSLASTRTLKSTRQLAPGAPPVVDEDDTYAPPKWKHTASVLWTGGNWNGSVFVSYMDGFKTNQSGNSLTWTYPVPSVYKVDLRGGYTFKDGVWRGYAKNLQIQAGIGNVFDKEPPFSDTVFGYNGGLHSQYAIGRTYELSFRLPF